MARTRPSATSPISSKPSPSPAQRRAEGGSSRWPSSRLIALSDDAHRHAHDLLDWLAVEYEITKPSTKLANPLDLGLDALVAEVKKLRGKKKPLSLAALRSLRDEHGRTIVPAQALPARPWPGAAGQRSRERCLRPDAGRCALMWETAPPRMPIPARHRDCNVHTPSTPHRGAPGLPLSTTITPEYKEHNRRPESLPCPKNAAILRHMHPYGLAACFSGCFLLHQKCTIPSREMGDQRTNYLSMMEAMPATTPSRFIFVDHSNIWGGHWPATKIKNPELPDWSARISVRNLDAVLQGGKKVTSLKIVSGGIPPGMEPVWQEYNKAGFDVQRLFKDHINWKECGVDHTIIGHMWRLLAKHQAAHVQLVLASGDGRTNEFGRVFSRFFKKFVYKICIPIGRCSYVPLIGVPRTLAA